jgi:hypothetical protein
MKKIINTLSTHPSALLLFVQLASIIIHPMLETVKYNQAIFSCFNVAALSLAVWIVNRSPAINWVAWVLAVPAIALTLLYVFSGEMRYFIGAQLLESAMYFYTAIGLVMYMFNDDVLTRDELFAAAATFTVLAWGFALIYSVCQYYFPGSITGSTAPTEPRTWLDLMFLSFTILSSTGYGDVMVTHPVTKIVSIFQMFVGLMYIALIVSRLISLTRTAQKS